jgi:hypothetical protein
MPMPLKTDMLDMTTLGLQELISGYDMINKGLTVKLGKIPQIVRIVYRALK